jgi:hypothetical protein
MTSAGGGGEGTGAGASGAAAGRGEQAKRRLATAARANGFMAAAIGVLTESLEREPPRGRAQGPLKLDVKCKSDAPCR